MKKIIAGVATLALLAACGNKQPGTNPLEANRSEIDPNSQRRDSLPQKPEVEETTPTERDGSFDDFIYSFASDDALQRRRILFPLLHYNGKTVSKIEERYWEHDDLFTKQAYYTLLFDREEELDLMGSNALTSVQVEWIYLPKRMVKQYCFKRMKGTWMLQSIHLKPIENEENEGFVPFFDRFANDSLFQRQRIRQPLQFVTIDPDDEFSVIEATIDLSQWFDFKPKLPTDKLSNITYGQKNDGRSPHKILALKGVGNGFTNILYFQRRNDGNWELYKFEDTSI